MWATPPGSRRRRNQRRAAIAGAAVVVVLALLLVAHVLREVVGLIDNRSPTMPGGVAGSAPPQAHPAMAEHVRPIAHAPSSIAAAPPVAGNSAFVVRSILPISGPIRFGQYYWDESHGEPGPLVVTVDLTARVLSVFENGHEVGATAILKGYGAKQTPIGVFPITQKDAHHISNIFDVPMPWMMRLTNDGVSIHGSKVERGYATNGCIGVPDAFAEKLFARAHLGDRVIITDGKRLKLGDPMIARPAA